MPWISNHKHKVKEKSTKSSRSSSKVVGLKPMDLLQFPTLYTYYKIPTQLFSERLVTKSWQMLGINLICSYSKAHIEMVKKLKFMWFILCKYEVKTLNLPHSCDKIFKSNLTWSSFY